VVSSPVPVRIRPSLWLSTGGLRRSCPRAANNRVVFRGHSSASCSPARQVAAASLSPLSSLCGLHCFVRGQHINSNSRRQHDGTSRQETLAGHHASMQPLKASIWKNEGMNGPFYNVTVARSYKDRDGVWKNSESFGVADLDALIVVAQQATRWIAERSDR